MYEDIKQQFSEVIKWSQGIQDPKISLLFEMWEQKKAKFIERFGGLIYEWPEPIEFTLDPKEKKRKAMDFSSIVYDTYRNAELTKFLDANINSFFDNVVEDTLDRSDIPKGMKLIKAFKFFEKDKNVLTNIQNYASQYIQENKIKGKLCFSVHPLDFLSSSENTYNWRSCHSLDGEFRAGNLSYMVDDVTFMVYLKGEDEKNLPNFPAHILWNSKKWRVLMHARPDDAIMFAGRQYPFSTKTGLDTVLHIYNNIMMKTAAPLNFWDPDPKYTSWNSNYISTYQDENDYTCELNDKYLVTRHKLIGLHEVVKEGPDALNYNDVLHSSCYNSPYYTFLYSNYGTTPNNLRENPILIGAGVTCLECGMDQIDDSGYMRCPECELEFGNSDDDCYTYCSCCDARIYYDDSYWVEDEPVCDRCYHDWCFECEDCGESFFTTNRQTIRMGPEDDAEIKYVCKLCAEDY